MARFGRTSRDRLYGCHVQIQQLMERVVEDYDCTILTGQRGQDEQDQAFDQGRSKLRFPYGKHNGNPSLAVDVAPWPIDWDNTKRFCHFAGYVQGIANEMGIPVRWGGDWDRNFKDIAEQNFNDLVHFELVG